MAVMSYTHNVESNNNTEDVAGDDVGPVAVVERVPCKTTQKGRHDSDQRQKWTEHIAAQTDTDDCLYVDLWHTRKIYGR